MGGLDNGNVVSHNFGGRKKWGGRQAGLVSPEVALIGLCVAFSFVFTWSPLCAWLVLFRRSVVSDSLWPLGLQHTRLPCSSPTPRACSNSCPLSQWCYQTISSAVIPFSSCLQSFPALGSFPMSQFFASNSQTIGASASASGLSMNIQDWFPLGLTGLNQFLGVQETLKSLLQHNNLKASVLWCSAFFMV